MRHLLLTCTLAAALGGGAAKAALNIPSDGSDGALVVTNDTVIDLSLAITGKWDTNNTAHAGMGVYDPEKWAIVFKYSSVNVGAGATVTFKNHASRAPVVWLVQGDVTIGGTLSLNGENSQIPPTLAEPGPGGFRGGSGYYALGAEDGPGFGPGGGRRRADSSGGWFGAGGSFGTLGYAGASTYGNPSLIPLIGGSGGGGRERIPVGSKAAGGAGGGAVLIASAHQIVVTGSLLANGGDGRVNGDAHVDSPGGSGGGIRLVSEDLAGDGLVAAVGGSDSMAGGVGRIRLERVNGAQSSLKTSPGPSIVDLEANATPLIWLPATGPSVRIVSIGTTNAPPDPRAGLGLIGADVTLPKTSSTIVVVETTNVETASTVKVRVTPRANGNFTETTLNVDKVITEDPLVIRWTNNVPVNDGYSAMQVRVVRP